MGLAAPKRKTKLSHDPNNTKWTNNPQSFGRKIMTSQGWKEGEYLGAKDAPHANYHTAANSSYIRIAIKDDNLGLGAKNGSGVGHGECTGLDDFKNLLGRLNGVNEEIIAKEQKSRDNARRKILIDRRWGCMNFVSAGFLVGDKIESLNGTEIVRARNHIEKIDTLSTNAERSYVYSDPKIDKCIIAIEHTRSKKRKADIPDKDETQVPPVSSKKIKKKYNLEKDVNNIEDLDGKNIPTTKKSKKSSSKVSLPKQNENELKRKGDKKCKESRDKDKADSDSKKSDTLLRKSKSSKRKDRQKVIQNPEDTPHRNLSSTLECIPAKSNRIGSGRPLPMQGRHVVRSKNIAQKRLASMDAASLNQIFMIKT